mmetsp:Transcript_20267/g.37845  ORF Transcript_20267/g.37845 Transcript_20267/m.37845 type:complete len:943 (-) Transcript_20267:6736-9564(-)
MADLTVKFKVKGTTNFGERLAVIGNAPELGAWNPARALALNTNSSEYPIWTSGEVHLSPRDLPWTMEYKYVKMRDANVVEWETFRGNRLIKVISQGTYQFVSDDVLHSIGQEKVLAAPPRILTEIKARSLSGVPNTLIDELAQGNATEKSWRNKLQLGFNVLNRVERDSDLALIASYLHFVKSGAIPCQEDGGHHRPNHHAALSTEITHKLASSETFQNSWLIRAILPSLPSDKPQFTASVPLTRIRDIAHRGDIPQDLKQEIKTTLQNKLHRSAGPEDLVTCERILRKVLGGSYSQAFVNELKTFYGELKEFFNAQGLDDRLKEVAEIKGSPLKHIVTDFLAAKFSDDLTHQRQLLLQIRDILHTARDLNTWICDIECECYCFVVYSKLLHNEHIDPRDFPTYIQYLRELIQHCVFSRFYDEEFTILIRELSSFREFPAGLKLLRLKSSLERCLRQTKDFALEITNNFQPDIARLGKSLRVDSHSVSVYSEAIVRSHIVFQLAKTCEIILKLVRRSVQASPWLVIQPGTCSGHIQRVRDFEEAQSLDQQVVVLVESADGTEEIPSNVAGYLLRHDLPQLSHLAVRTRQRKVPAAACEDSDKFDSLRIPVTGSLIIAKDSVKFSQTLEASQKVEPVSVTEMRDINQDVIECMNIEEVTRETGGFKAYGARLLQEMGNERFKTPFSACIPFGRCRQVIGRLTMPTREAAIKHIKQSFEISEALLNETAGEVMNLTGSGRKIILRSSSNAEDNAGVSGAGLYDSIPNIMSDDLESIKGAICDVWLSLCTERAWLSRSQSGISHASVCMAILVQEMMPADYSFIVHTSNPTDPGEMFAEMACGLGETLASAEQRGSPYRFVYKEESGEMNVVTLASYSFGLYPGPKGLVKQRIDYHSEDLDQLKAWAMQMFEASSHIRTSLESEQDIEGLVADGQVFIVQTRPQV